MEQLYKIKRSTLVEIADALREKTGLSDEIGVLEMAAVLRSISTGGEWVLPSEGVAFSEGPQEGDPQYKVGQNWIAELVRLIHRMSGTGHNLTKDEMVYWLGRVVYMPQGWADTLLTWPDDFDYGSIARGWLPDLKRSNGEGQLPGGAFNLQGSGSGKVFSPVRGEAIGAPLNGLGWSTTASGMGVN